MSWEAACLFPKVADRALSDEDARVRRKAVMVLGSWGELAAEQASALAEVLAGDQEANVRWEAAIALAAVAVEMNKRTCGASANKDIGTRSWRTMLTSSSMVSRRCWPPARDSSREKLEQERLRKYMWQHGPIESHSKLRTHKHCWDLSRQVDNILS